MSVEQDLARINCKVQEWKTFLRRWHSLRRKGDCAPDEAAPNIEMGNRRLRQLRKEREAIEARR
jgi:hypothetical protein